MRGLQDQVKGLLELQDQVKGLLELLDQVKELQELQDQVTGLQEQVKNMQVSNCRSFCCFINTIFMLSRSPSATTVSVRTIWRRWGSSNSTFASSVSPLILQIL